MIVRENLLNYLYTYRLALLFAWCPVPLNSLHTCWSRLLQIHIPSPSRFQRHKNGYRHRLWLQFSSTHHHWQTFGRRSTLLLPPHCYLVLSILELFHQLLWQYQEHLRRKEGKLRVGFINTNWNKQIRTWKNKFIFFNSTVTLSAIKESLWPNVKRTFLILRETVLLCLESHSRQNANGRFRLTFVLGLNTKLQINKINKWRSRVINWRSIVLQTTRPKPHAELYMRLTESQFGST